MEYLSHKKQKPKAGQLCLVKCPGWSSLEFIVAKWTGKRFDFPDNDSPNFLRWVKGYLPLTVDGKVDKHAWYDAHNTADRQHQLDLAKYGTQGIKYANPLERKAAAREAMRTFGLLSGVFSKVLLEMGGCEVDYKINGENIEDIKELQAFDIKERMELAVKEMRFEDAAFFRDKLKTIEVKPE